MEGERQLEKKEYNSMEGERQLKKPLNAIEGDRQKKTNIIQQKEKDR